MKKIAMLMIVLMVVGSVSAFAGICPKTDKWIEGKVNSEEYVVKMGGMMLDGVNRIVAAPFDLLYHPYHDVFVEKHYGTGLFTGLGEGLFRGVEGIMVGAWNIVSSVVPGYHGETTDHVHSLLPCKKEATA
jgi:hypothetical protein